ncbi:conserved hypothetical protein [Ricinus communis]|uniref:Uncharacterized protein n=1 Tax=Ricinus communis TaxID=3988 RepID=B9SYQ8_RICCO|nr:conserved hypothetical protein [Ricinus communis]
METKKNQDYMERVRRRLRFDCSCYVDPQGLSEALAVWRNLKYLEPFRRFTNNKWCNMASDLCLRAIVNRWERGGLERDKKTELER